MNQTKTRRLGWKAAIAGSLAVSVFGTVLSTGVLAAADAPAVASAVLSTVNVDSSNYLPVGTDYKTILKSYLDASDGAGLKPGYGSALAYKDTLPDGSIEYYALTDRGPNADGPNVTYNGKTYTSKFFLTPDFNPGIGVLKVSPDGTAELEKGSIIKLKNKEGTSLDGLPYQSVQGSDANGNTYPGSAVADTGEVALDPAGNVLNSHENPSADNGWKISSIDSEGLGITYENGQPYFWVSDEYGPFITEFDSTGKEVQTYMPGHGLPDYLSSRIPNRGIECLSVTPEGKIVAVVQSVLNVDTDGNGQYEQMKGFSASLTRILVIDPSVKAADDPTGAQVKVYGYPVSKAPADGQDGITYDKAKDVKIGDVHAFSEDKLLIIEQGADVNTDSVRHMVYEVDLSSAKELPADTTPETAFFNAGNDTAADANLTENYGLATKSLLFDLDAIQAKDADGNAVQWSEEKAEGITVLPDNHTVAISNDNDFQANYTLTTPSSSVTDITKYTYDATTKTYTYKGATVAEGFAVQFAPNTEQDNLITVKLDKPLVEGGSGSVDTTGLTDRFTSMLTASGGTFSGTAGNVSVSFDGSVLPDGVGASQLTTGTLSSGGTYDDILKALDAQGYKNLGINDIKLLDTNNHLITSLSGNGATVKIQIPDGASGKLHVLYYDPADKSLHDMSAAAFDDGFLTFNTTHFSDYIVAQETLNSSSDNGSSGSNSGSGSVSSASNPKTGVDGSGFGPAITIMGLASAGALLVLGRKRK